MIFVQWWMWMGTILPRRQRGCLVHCPCCVGTTIGCGGCSEKCSKAMEKKEKSIQFKLYLATHHSFSFTTGRSYAAARARVVLALHRTRARDEAMVSTKSRGLRVRSNSGARDD